MRIDSSIARGLHRASLLCALFLTALPPAMAQTAQPFRRLQCTGVPNYPKGKTVMLGAGQIFESASVPAIQFVELDGAVGLTYYTVTRAGPRRLTGEATAISTFDWSHRTQRVTCTILG